MANAGSLIWLFHSSNFGFSVHLVSFSVLVCARAFFLSGFSLGVLSSFD